jgi:phospholipid/cholesterol/gamma-HCH transport system permease protein
MIFITLAVDFIEEAGRLWSFFAQLAGEAWNFLRGGRKAWRLDGRVIFEQLEHIGTASVPVVLITALFTGMVLALQASITLEVKLKGVSQFIGRTVALPFIRELGPVLTGLIVAGRIGSAIAAEIGTMAVTEQIDALQTLATPPLRYLGLPRFLALTVMMPLLTAMSSIVGLLGGYLVAGGLLGISARTYFGDIPEMVGMGDLVSGMGKTVFFGAIIAVVSCYQGFSTTGGAEGVGHATTKAVVWSSILILVSDYFLTSLFALFT